jgi:hypothetical protein
MAKHLFPETGHSPNLQRWFDWMEHDHSPAGLAPLLADEVVFKSPVVHTPQEGKFITMGYLLAAGETLGNDSFRYTRVFDCGDRAVLEFETEMDGIAVNGVDMIAWNGDGQITDFKVMVRPLKAINAVHAAMGAMLAKMKAGA